MDELSLLELVAHKLYVEKRNEENKPSIHLVALSEETKVLYLQKAENALRRFNQENKAFKVFFNNEYPHLKFDEFPHEKFFECAIKTQ